MKSSSTQSTKRPTPNAAFDSCKQIRKRRIAYIASGADVKPVIDTPDADFVFLTPEPTHEVAINHWPEPCRGYRWFVEGGAPLFLDVILGCLGREEWAFKTNGENAVLYTNNKTGQTVQLFMNMTVSEYSQEAATAISKCDDYIHHGWAPSVDDKRDLDRLVSGLRYAKEMESTPGDFEPADGLDVDVKVGSAWVFVPDDFNASSDDEEESVQSSDEESVDGDASE